MMNISQHIYFISGEGFSIRLLMFGYMELDLLTPVSQPPSGGMHQHSIIITYDTLYKFFSNRKLPNHFVWGIVPLLECLAV